jgi:hypothetical protein
VDLSKNKTAVAAGVAVAAIVTTVALGMAAWPALTRPDPPAEATGDDGLRIRLVEPPKALITRGSPLDVGLSEAAQAMAKGREALFVRTPPVRPEPAASTPPRRAPIEIAQVDEDEDLAPPPEPLDDRWDRSAWRRDRFEDQRREEEQRMARREREQRAAWEQAQRDRERWEDAREQERQDALRYENRRDEDRYAPPPSRDDDRPPPGW